MADKKNSNKEIDKMNNHQNYDDDKKPNFEDPESFVDDVDDEGERPVLLVIPGILMP